MVQVPNYDTTNGAPLPTGWVRWVDPKTDDFYYHNESSGETTWDDPTRWKVGLLLDRFRGDAPKAEALPYRPRTIECAFAEHSAVSSWHSKIFIWSWATSPLSRLAKSFCTCVHQMVLQYI